MNIIDLSGVADMIGVTVGSARTYHARAEINRGRGKYSPSDLPMPDYILACRPAWNADTIEQWMAKRPGKGNRKPRSGSGATTGPVSLPRPPE